MSEDKKEPEKMEPKKEPEKKIVIEAPMIHKPGLIRKIYFNEMTTREILTMFNYKATPIPIRDKRDLCVFLHQKFGAVVIW